MKILHFDCSMGAAGDMLTAALLELFDDRQAVLEQLNSLGIPRVRFAAESSVKCGVTGTHLRVTVDGAEEDDHDHHSHEHEHEHPHDHDHIHEHHDHEHEHDHEHHEHDHEHEHAHSSMTDIRAIAETLNVNDAVKAHVIAVYESIAAAESAVHGVPAEEIHFHEVGSLDAVADVTAFAYLMDRLAPDRVTASPVHVGSGQVRCTHGILPVPAPATALLLRGVPIYGGQIRGELCTPTGAALLKHYVNSFGEMPVLYTDRIGYGMGKRDFPAANCVRAFLGTSDNRTEEMYSLSCNIDDMTAEAIGYACQVLREAGAPEVFTQAANMKKDRPGTILTVICRPEQRQDMAALMLRHTSTIGVRETALRRYVLERSIKTVETPFGPVRKKVSTGYGVLREKYEHDDLARIAKERGVSLGEIISELG